MEPPGQGNYAHPLEPGSGLETILRGNAPNLPVYTDGILSERLTEQLGKAIAAQGGWLHKTEIPMHRALQFLDGGRPYRCNAGDTLITVQPNGDVYSCRRMPIRAGNVFETSLVTIYDESPVLRALRGRETPSRGCENCGFFDRCRGGLRCLDSAVTGDPYRSHPVLGHS